MSEEKKLKPLAKKNFNLAAYKAVNKLDDGVKDKEVQFIPMSPAFYAVTGIPGIIKGTVNMFRGYSNTGKSTGMIECCVGAQRTGVLPVIVDTENAWNWTHAREMGFEFDEIVDNETGEIVNYEGFFIYVNNDYLIEHFGKKRSKTRDEAVVEDVAEFINKTLDDQQKGELECELLFAWDSVGTLDCNQGVESNSRNNQWVAGSLEVSFRSIINHKIPASRKENKKYTNTFLVINKIWYNAAVGGMGVVMNKGGFAFQYATRLQATYGSQITHGTKKLVAKADGKEYVWGTLTKVNIEKNHITGVSFGGPIISTAHGFILPEDQEKYKKENKKYILSKLGIFSDVKIIFSEEDDNGKIDYEE